MISAFFLLLLPKFLFQNAYSFKDLQVLLQAYANSSDLIILLKNRQSNKPQMPL